MNLQQMLSLTGKREASFRLMFDHLKTIDSPLIIETGCARWENNFEGDGMSTLLFDQYIFQNGGTLYSIDITQEHIDFARSQIKCSNSNLICSDSIIWLYNFAKTTEKKIDLLYLDSYDLDFNNPHPSSLHHIMELAAIMPALSEKTMVCVDDNLSYCGKGHYVDIFMKTINAKKVYDGYQWIWNFGE